MPREPHRDEQRSAAPCFSPGPVQSAEVVLRTLIDPDHFADDGTLKPVAIALEDIRSRGWSVDRTDFTSLWRIRLFHANWRRRRPEIHGFYVLRIPVGDIRNIVETATHKQEFVVVDTAKFLHPSHAEVLLSAGGNHKPSALRGFRTKLIQKLPPRIDVSQSFDSTEKYGFARGMLLQLGAILHSPFKCSRQLMLSAIARFHKS